VIVNSSLVGNLDENQICKSIEFLVSTADQKSQVNFYQFKVVLNLSSLRACKRS
jgi:hypothetical protein